MSLPHRQLLQRCKTAQKIRALRRKIATLQMRVEAQQVAIRTERAEHKATERLYTMATNKLRDAKALIALLKKS